MLGHEVDIFFSRKTVTLEFIKAIKYD